jgi:hypothetical protein
MANFESGCSGFVKAYAVVQVGFPIDWRGNAEIACKHCNFFIRATQRCALNQEVVNFPDKYVGQYCPLEIVEENEGENENV